MFAIFISIALRVLVMFLISKYVYILSHIDKGDMAWSMLVLVLIAIYRSCTVAYTR